MKTRFCSSWVMGMILISLTVGALQAQTPPPESTSKVKRVLLYNYNGGWNCADCRKETQKVFFQLAQAKGFAVDTSSSISDLTLENLKRYQVIVWNNNHGGVYSVSDTAARMAVSAYIQQGGGWLLINIANEHNGSWRFLDSLIGPGTSGWVGSIKPATLVPDSLVQRHPELRFLVDAMPDSIPLRTNWLRMSNPIVDSNHIHVIYRLKNADWITTDPNFIPTYQDHYIWASTRQKGKALSLPLGWYGGVGTTNIMTQADSAVPKLYWQGLRWLAGDFQGGCINPDDPNFAPEARVDDGSCPPSGVRANFRHAPALFQVKGRRVQFTSPTSGESRMQMRDLQGRSMGKFILPKAAASFDLPSGLLPGLYFLEITEAKTALHARILIP